MARNKKSAAGKRYNVPSETLERARAEIRGDIIADVPEEKVVKAQSDLNKASAPKVKRATTSGSASRKVPTIEELRKEYAYVGGELRTLAILAVALLAVIFVAALLLPKPLG